MTWSRSRTLAAVLALALVAGACGGATDDATEEAGQTTTTTAVGAGRDSTTTAPPSPEAPPAGVIEIEIAGGNVVGGVRRETVAQGSTVTLRITSDVTDELHVHTYDRTVELAPGDPAELTFEATIPGIHEVELEERHKKVLELEVSA